VIYFRDDVPPKDKHKHLLYSVLRGYMYLFTLLEYHLNTL